MCENNSHYALRTHIASVMSSYSTFNRCIHTIRRTHTLPLTIPSSIFGEYGYVRYDVCVALDMPWQPDTKFKSPFTVIQPVDLNQFPILKVNNGIDSVKIMIYWLIEIFLFYQSPVNIEEEHTFYVCFYFCCCESDPLILRAQLPVEGYAYIPGQTIDMEFEVIKKSNVRVLGFTFQLVRVSRLISLLSGWEKSNRYYFCSKLLALRKIKCVVQLRNLKLSLFPLKRDQGAIRIMKNVDQVNFVVPAVVTCTSSEIMKVEFFIRVSWRREFDDSLNIRITLLFLWRF